jgi:hypothetical protein
MSPNNSNGYSSGNGPITPIGPSNGGGNSGFNGNAFLTFMSRPDLNYQSTALMNIYLNQCKIWAESLSKAIQATTNKDHHNYGCLGCKMPGKYSKLNSLKILHNTDFLNIILQIGQEQYWFYLANTKFYAQIVDP